MALPTIPQYDDNSAQLTKAATILAGRLFKSTDAPFGVVGSLDVGSAYIRNEHPDVLAMLYGRRGMGVGANQEWPSVEEVAQTNLNVPYNRLPVEKQAALDKALQAAVEWIVRHCEQSFGVG